MDCLESVDGNRNAAGWGVMNTLHRAYPILLAAALLSGCPAPAGDVGDLPGESGSTSEGSSDDANDDGSPSGTGTSSAGETGDGGDTGALDCSDGGYGCCIDRDADGVEFPDDIDDTVPDAANQDSDQDGLLDADDLCPFRAGGAPIDVTADADRDGVGNACDRCGLAPSAYVVGVATPEYMQIRALPLTGDLDGDGIGDACDNCPTVPNCYGLGVDEVFSGEIPEIDGVECQADADGDGVGDACEDTSAELAAGPVGFGDADDFDQDGLINAIDACPRTPLGGAPLVCSPDSPCPDGQTCTAAGICNHVDSDDDGVGDVCDTCAYVPNPAQAMAGGAQEDDRDADGVGEVCEIGADHGCGDRINPARIDHRPVSSGGSCCTVELLELADGGLARADDCFGTHEACNPLLAPHPENPGSFLPLRLASACSAAQQAAFECAVLPAALEQAAGVLSMAPGCESALAEAGLTLEENQTAVPGEDEASLQTCRRPQRDYDFDGVANVCDLCPLSYDPLQELYVDEEGRLWPDDGAMCNGAYACAD